MLNLSLPEKCTSTGFDASTLIHTSDGLRCVSALNIGDLVLTPDASGNQFEAREVIKIEKVENAPIVKAVFAFQSKNESLFIAGLPYLLVSGIALDVSSNPDWLDHLRKKIGWQEICSVESGLRVHSITDPSAYIWHVDQVWKSNVAPVGWTAPDRDSGMAYKIEFNGNEIVEHADGVVCNELVEGVFLDEFLHCDRHDSNDVAEALAMRRAVFSIEVQDNRPFFVGRNGLLIQPGTASHSFGVWAHERIWED